MNRREFIAGLGSRWSDRWDSGRRVRSSGFGAAINHHLKPHLVRSTFDSCRADGIEGTAPMGQQRTPAVHNVESARRTPPGIFEVQGPTRITPSR
jgi:hypothetical protein